METVEKTAHVRNMANRGQLLELRESLQTSRDVVSALQSLNTLLEASSRTEVLEIASFLSLQLLFKFLSTGSDEQIKPCCAVIDKIFSSMPAEEVCNYSQYIELGLQHFTSSEVRRMSLVMLKRNSRSRVVQETILAPTMFHLVTQVIGDESLECAKLAADLFLEVVTNPQSLDVKLRESFLMDVTGLMSRSDTVRYRVYDLLVSMALRGSETFVFVQSTGLLQRLVGELDLDDVLVKMNCIELLISLLNSPDGVSFLEDSEVLKKLHSLLLSAQQDPLGSFVEPGILKYFGHVALCTGTDLPAIVVKYPEFLRVILSAVHSPEDTVWGVAVDTLGAVGSTQSGRRALEACDSDVKESLKALGSLVDSSKTDLRIRALGVLAMLLSCREEDASWERSKSREWFHLLHPKVFSVLMQVVRQPFEDVRTAGLRVLVVMAQWAWGQREMCQHPGFLEYLLDRRTEPDKIGKELKYDVVHTLVVSDTAEQAFGSPAFLKLRKFDREGPFFVLVDTSVALDESS